jgi:integrase
MNRSDNFHLSDIQAGQDNTPDPVAFYLSAARAKNTLRAYEADLLAFKKAGGCIPATPGMVAHYIANQAARLAVSTLRRRIAAIAWAHRELGFSDPTKNTKVRGVLRGIERHHGILQKRAKPFLLEDLAVVCRSLDNTPRDARDKALLTVGFFGALRSSELVSIRIEDIASSTNFLKALIRRGKTDQRQAGREIILPRIGHAACPVAACLQWLAKTGRTHGWLFPALGRTDATATHLSARQVSRVICARRSQAGLLASGYSSHSLRSGFITSASEGGMTPLQIANQSGHGSLESTLAYMRSEAEDIGNQIRNAMSKNCIKPKVRP